MRETIRRLDENRLLIRSDYGLSGMVFGGVLLLAAAHLFGALSGVNPLMDTTDLSPKEVRALFAFASGLLIAGLALSAFRIRVVFDRETGSVSKVFCLLHPRMTLYRRRVRLNGFSSVSLEQDPGDGDVLSSCRIYLSSGPGGGPARLDVSASNDVRQASGKLKRIRGFLQKE